MEPERDPFEKDYHLPDPEDMLLFDVLAQVVGLSLPILEAR